MRIPTKPGSRQPDYHAFYAESAPTVRDLLTTPLPPDLLNDYFLMSIKAFFVHAPSLHFALKGAISQIQRDASAMLTPPSQPSRKELDALRRGDAMSLFAILRIHACFEDMVMRDGPSSPLLREGGMANGLPRGSIIPSIWRFDRSAYRRLLDEYQLTSADVPKVLHQLAPQARGDMMRVLAQGYARSGGPRTGAYRVTDALVSLISEAISIATYGQADESEVRERVFDPSANRGPGNGTMTQALPIEFGNISIKPPGYAYNRYFFEGAEGRVGVAPPDLARSARGDSARLLSVRSDDDGTWMSTREGVPRISCYVPPDKGAATVFWPHGGAEAPFVRYFMELSEQQPHWGQTIKFFHDEELIIDQPDDDDLESNDPPEMLPKRPDDDWRSGARSVSMELAPRTKHSNDSPAVVWYSVNGKAPPEAGVALSIDMLGRQSNRLASLIAGTHETRLGAIGAMEALKVLTAIQNRPQL